MSFQNVHLEKNNKNTPAAILPDFTTIPLPQLPLSIIDETSSVGLICHYVGCTRLWAAAVVAEGDQLMPREEKWDKGRAH